MPEVLTHAIDIFLHLDRHLDDWAGSMGPWFHALLFVIVFCETGLVVTPFLPGDSLLFAVGALASLKGTVNAFTAGAVLLAAAVLGDAVNYTIGHWVGPRVFTREDSRLLNRRHLLRTQRFYEKHGGKTIVLARFIPIIRTFAPFVAGIGRMRYARFALFNVTGGAAWVVLGLAAGYLFGNVPVVKRNFSLVLVAIVVVSVLPVVFEYVRARREARTARTRTPVG